MPIDNIIKEIEFKDYNISKPIKNKKISNLRFIIGWLCGF